MLHLVLGGLIIYSVVLRPAYTMAEKIFGSAVRLHVCSIGVIVSDGFVDVCRGVDGPVVLLDSIWSKKLQHSMS